MIIDRYPSRCLVDFNGAHFCSGDAIQHIDSVFVPGQVIDHFTTVCENDPAGRDFFILRGCSVCADKGGVGGIIRITADEKGIFSGGEMKCGSACCFCDIHRGCGEPV